MRRLGIFYSLLIIPAVATRRYLLLMEELTVAVAKERRSTCYEHKLLYCFYSLDLVETHSKAGIMAFYLIINQVPMTFNDMSALSPSEEVKSKALA
jgi:hypothetical protein